MQYLMVGNFQFFLEKQKNLSFYYRKIYYYLNVIALLFNFRVCKTSRNRRERCRYYMRTTYQVSTLLF